MVHLYEEFFFFQLKPFLHPPPPPSTHTAISLQKVIVYILLENNIKI